MVSACSLHPPQDVSASGANRKIDGMSEEALGDRKSDQGSSQDNVGKQESRMKHIEVTLFGKTYPITLDECKYSNGTTCVRLFTEGSPFAILSVNLLESPALPPGVFYAKYWSENRGIVEQLESQGIIELVEEIPFATSGFLEMIAAYRLVNNK